MEKSNPNGSQVRIRDIADALGLSTATVSNVIHSKTAKISAATVDRVQKALDEFGYTPNMAAISLAQNYSPVVGVVVCATQRYQQAMLTDPFISRMLDSVSSELEAQNYFLMLRRETNILNVPKYARMWNWAGAIFMGFPQQAYSDLEGKMCVPYLIVDGGAEGNPHYSSARLDNFAAGFQAGNYLIENRHRKICYMSDAQQIKSGSAAGTASLRYWGLAEAMKQRCPELPAPKHYPLPGMPEERRRVYEQLRLSALRGELTAVFSVADLFAIELANHLTDSGMKLPEQLSVVGFDDIEPASVVRPRLTTFRQNLQERGHTIVAMLMRMIREHTPPEHVTDPVQMIVRESVCPPPAMRG